MIVNNPLKLLLALLALVAIHPAASADTAADPFTRDVLMISQWFEGEFDNEEQRWFHQRSNAEGEPPLRMHTAHKRIDAPSFGQHVFYVEEYKDNNPSAVIRQRLVTFESDLEANAIRMRQGFFNNADQWRGAYQPSATVPNLNVSDVSFLDGCDVFIHRVADQFEGSMEAKACVFGDGDKRRYSVHDLVISETKFWRTDATFLLADDSFYKGTPIGEPIELRRAQFFSCDMYFYGDTRADQQAVEDLRIHNQGGTASATRESDQQGFQLLLRSKEYPYYESRPDFIYYSIRHAGEERSIAFGVADPQSRQFGLNAGKIAAFCHREGYTFQQNFDEL